MEFNCKKMLLVFLICSAKRCSNSASCGGKLSDPEGNITSPNYPDDYPPGVFCFWEIVVPFSDVIILEFIDFELEFAIKGCDYDYLIIIDGNSELRYCGNELPPQLRSHGYKLTLGFVTDANSQHKGFLASYRTINRLEPEVTSTTLVPSTSTHLYQECGGNIYDSGATVLSPGYPDTYPNNVVCIWNIQPRYGDRIYMTIELLDIDDSNQCSDDYLEMLDSDLEILGRFCGNIVPSLVIVAEKRMTVVFKSDDHVTKRGFKLSYTNREVEVQSSVTQTFPPTKRPPTIIDYLTDDATKRKSSSSPGSSQSSGSFTTTLQAGIKDRGNTSQTLQDNFITTEMPDEKPRNKGSLNAKSIGIAVGFVLMLVVVILVLVYYIKRRKRTSSLLDRDNYSNMAPQLRYGSEKMTAKSNPDLENVSNEGYDGIQDTDASNLSEISTPWGTAKRSQLREISPHYYGTGSRPQLGLPETRIEAN